MSYYKILGLEKTATPEEIKKSYRKLSLKYHPDKPTGDAEEFKKINEAYTTLGDLERKEIYDMKEANPFGRRFSSGPGGFHGHGGFNGDIMPDIFKMFFNQSNMSPEEMDIPFFNQNMRVFHNGRPINIERRLARPPPICKTINISFKESFTGINYPLEIERWIHVLGTKKIEKEKLYLNIPKGVDDGEIIIIKERGNILNNSLKGDIKIFIKIKNDSEYTRHGIDLVYKKSITLIEALSGFNFEIKYLNDQLINLNNQSVVIYPGYKKILSGYGFERNDSKGNLIIEFNVKFPNSLNNEQKEKLKNIL
jgi:DnaJ-class molecular chaperone